MEASIISRTLEISSHRPCGTVEQTPPVTLELFKAVYPVKHKQGSLRKAMKTVFWKSHAWFVSLVMFYSPRWNKKKECWCSALWWTSSKAGSDASQLQRWLIYVIKVDEKKRTHMLYLSIKVPKRSLMVFWMFSVHSQLHWSFISRHRMFKATSATAVSAGHRQNKMHL